MVIYLQLPGEYYAQHGFCHGEQIYYAVSSGKFA